MTDIEDKTDSIIGTIYKKPVYINREGRVYYKLKDGSEVDLDIDVTEKGVRRCKLLANGTKRSTFHNLDRLMCAAYHGGSTRKVKHLDGDISNCNLDNLRYYNDIDKSKLQSEYNKKYYSNRKSKKRFGKR